MYYSTHICSIVKKHTKQIQAMAIPFNPHMKGMWAKIVILDFFQTLDIYRLHFNFNFKIFKNQKKKNYVYVNIALISFLFRHEDLHPDSLKLIEIWCRNLEKKMLVVFLLSQ